MSKLAIIHTTPATIEPLKALAAEILPGYEVVNFIDDSILPQLAQNGGDVSAVEGRVLQYARFAEEVGADAILEACSSIGEVVEKARPLLSVPILRIDEAMAEEAVALSTTGGTRIGVAATLATTLRPTLALLQQKATAAGREVTFEPLLVSAAYQKLINGDKTGHDQTLAEALTTLAANVDLVVLAQASMARVVPTLPAEIQGQFLSSPRLAMERMREMLAADR
jgi:Asp/Glu/hydantoin racemase